MFSLTSAHLVVAGFNMTMSCLRYNISSLSLGTTMAHSQYLFHTSGVVYITHMLPQAFYAIASTTIDQQP